MAAGDFTASTLATVIERQDALFNDPRNSRLYQPQTVALQEIVQEQTALIDKITASAQNKVKIAFINTNGISATDCTTPTCTPTGILLETAAPEYELTQCAEATSFKVEVPVGVDPSSIYANGVIGYADVIAAGQLRQKKEIEEKIATRALALVVAKAGTNADTLAELGETYTATNTTIPAAFWNADLFPFFQQEAALNRFTMPYMLHGRNLNLSRLQAVPNAQNTDQRDEQAKYSLIESAWDPFTFSRAGIAGVSLLIDAGAIAFAARNVYSRNMVQPDEKTTVYSTPSISFANTMDFDVEVYRTCEVVTVGGKSVKKWFDVYSMKEPFYDIISNPNNGLAGDTGVLKFTKGA